MSNISPTLAGIGLSNPNVKLVIISNRSKTGLMITTKSSLDEKEHIQGSILHPWKSYQQGRQCFRHDKITVDGEMEQLNSKLVVNPEIWDAKTGRALGRSAKVLELNGRLNDIQVIRKEHYYDIPTSAVKAKTL